MTSDGLRQFLQLSVDTPLSERRLEGCGVKKDVDIFRKPLNEVPSFNQARPAFEDGFVAARGRDDAQGLGNVVVLLDNRWTQGSARENALSPEELPARNQDARIASI